ncbi:chorismate--pyruvate lyase family protein [Halomonas huangheensis]|uniref:Probable chorismate pyruvate-lyase n=1 Tax=Halomonas huangheensis TaxID=1178482 RepID=W1N609_9GAMM|nr:chorismate lyase [Halomonas huangheensis]ALM54378.1 chorismate lyase [Halomonas huangheensis]ERL50939.1 hypothetical protein BJB45_20305 [Halomonas huangheensis]
MTQDPRWQPLATARPKMSQSWWQWISSRDSLTQRLVQAAGERRFNVRLLDERSGQPYHDEAAALGLMDGRRAWLREVALCVDDQPWVVARSVAPLVPRRSAPFAGLGETSLGSWLFRQPDLERGPIEVSQSPRPIHGESGIWQRRSVFRHDGWALLVQEAFLPQMCRDLSLTP